MKKKTIVATAVASCLALTATFAGCSLVTTNNKADMQQVIATVDITKLDSFKDSSLYAYKDAVVGETSIVKRNLVSYFLNVGYSLIQNGRTYEETFNMLLDALCDNAVLVQYSTMALLEMKVNEGKGSLEEYKSKETRKEKLEYLLDEDDVLLATYKVYSSVNAAIDNQEKTFIDDEDEYAGTDTRTTPTNLETENDDYYPIENGKLNYNIYTGIKNADYDYSIKNSGAYQDDMLDGSTGTTRIKAYNSFLKNLKSNNLITEEDEEGDLFDVLSLSYLDDEYISQLETRVINRYMDKYEEQQAEKLLDKDNDSYIQNRYDELLNRQKKNYKDGSAFESAMGNMSSTSFLLYCPEYEDNELEKYEGFDSKVDYGRFGYVYNILLPFDAKQSASLNSLKSKLNLDDNELNYYNGRNKLLQKIKTEDQRAAWFNGATNYSFEVNEESAYKDDYFGKADGRNYLFFEGNLTDSGEGKRYKELQAYDGRYSYNGNVYENDDGSYTLLGEELDIDGMLEEFSAYINYVLGNDKEYVEYETNAHFYDEFGDSKKLYKDGKEKEKEIDYSNFIYAYGKVNFGEFNHNDLMNVGEKPAQYKAMSAVNELQFAYTTDTSVLSQYVGYSVSAYDTSFIKEFEYAAKLAISGGEGSFTVCAGDYGWHLIYVTSVFDGETYENLNWDRVEVEGTFENLFFEWIKSNDLNDITSTRRSKILKDFSKEDESVVKYQKRYQDLLDLDNNNN